MEGSVAILICCNGGISAAMLATRMNRWAKARDLDLVVDAMPIRRGQVALARFDVVLLAPGVSPYAQELKTYAGACAVDVIPMKMYGRFDGEAVGNLALSLLPPARCAVAQRDVEQVVASEAKAQLETFTEGAALNEAAREARPPKRLLVVLGGGPGAAELLDGLKKNVEARDLDLEVLEPAAPVATSAHKGADCVLVAPQEVLAYQHLVKACGGTIPVALIAQEAYEAKDAPAIINQALLLMAEQNLKRCRG